MGSMSSISRCDRFIQMFNERATARMTIPEQVRVVGQALAFDEAEEVVRYCIAVEVGGETLHFYSDCSWFNPDLPEEDTIELTAVSLGIPEEEAAQLLREANLIG